MATFKIEGLDGVLSKFEAIKDHLKREIKPRFDEISKRFVEDVKGSQLSGKPGLGVVTGRLRESFISLVNDEQSGIEVVVGTPVEYIQYHEGSRVHLGDTWNQYAPQYLEAVGEVLEEALNE